MKKVIYASSAVLLCVVFAFACYSKFWKAQNSRLPNAENEENAQRRAAWEKQLLADPATGEIPAGIYFDERAFAEGLPRRNGKHMERNNNGEWSFRGPWNVGGRTRAMALDVLNEQHILAGGVSGGLWESLDGGQTWTRRTPLNAHPGCVSIAQDTRPGHESTWYYLSGEVYGTSASGGNAFYLGDGMFKSTDNGTTWTPISSTAGGNPHSFTSFYQSGWKVITDPVATDDVVYMTTVGAVYRSINGGNTWTAVRGGSLSAYSYFAEIAITSTGVLYATLSSDGPQKGVWRSENGTTWTNITPANFNVTYNRFVIGINPNNENEVYFLGNTPGSGHYNNYIDSDDWSSLWKYTYVSGDGSGTGGTWADLSLNLPAQGTEFDQFACQGGYDLIVKVQPGTNTVFVGGTNIYRSTDGFSTPDNTSMIGGYKPGTTLPFFEIYPEHHPDQHELLFLPSNSNVLLSASDGGVRRTNDCTANPVSWVQLNNGYQTAQHYTVMIEHTIADDPMIISGLQDNGNFFTNSASPSASWVQTVNGDGAFGAIADGHAGYILSIQLGRVAKVSLGSDGAVNAFRRIDPIGVDKNDYQFINPLALDPADQNKLYLPAGRRLFRQDDLAAIDLTGAWDSISQGWTQFPDTLVGVANSFSAIAVTKANPAHRVYLGSTNNKLYRIDNAHEGAPTFTALTLPPVGGAYVTCLAVDPDDGNKVIVCYSNYGVYSMFASDDAGMTWRKVAGNLETSIAGSGAGVSVRWVSILPFSDGKRKYFCGTSVGLFSADTLVTHTPQLPGTQWVMEGADVIGSAVVPMVETRAVDGLVLAATHGNGMFSANFTQDVSAPEANTADRLRVFPTPTVDVLNFDFRKWDYGNLSLKIYDSAGKTVEQTTISAGQNQVKMGHLTPGVYFWEVKGKGWRQTGKTVKI